MKKVNSANITNWNLIGSAVAEGAVYLYGVDRKKSHLLTCFRANFKDTNQLENYIEQIPSTKNIVEKSSIESEGSSKENFGAPMLESTSLSNSPMKRTRNITKTSDKGNITPLRRVKIIRDNKNNISSSNSSSQASKIQVMSNNTNSSDGFSVLERVKNFENK